mgnify:CR=1 FL=1
MEDTLFSFSEALELMKKGSIMARKAWNNPSISVAIQFPDENSANTEPYLYMVKKIVENDDTKSQNKRFPLDLSCESIFASDWFII